MTMKLFDQVEALAQKVKTEEAWFQLEGRVFEKFKVKLRSGGDEWQRAFTKGMQQFSRRLSPGARRQFNQDAQNVLTIDPEAFRMGTREALRSTNALVQVAAVGPELDSLDSIPADIAKLYGIDDGVLPEHIRSLYKRRPDGKYVIPTQTEPPPEWVATSEQVFNWLANDDFITQIGNFRRQLVDEGVEAEEDELGN